MFSSPISGVTPISHCAVGQLGLNKSSLRHKVRPIELIFPPPKNNITVWFFEHVFNSPATRHLFPMEESQIFCNSTINKEADPVPRGCPSSSHLIIVGTLHKRYALLKEICQNLLLVILISKNQFERLKGIMKQLGNSSYNK